MKKLALAVDDDRQSLALFEQALRPTGAQTLLAEDGASAIDLLRQHTPDILFLDMLLPRVNGFEVLDYILTAPHLRQLYVVVVSAHNHFDPCPQLDRADAYLVKPITAKMVRDAFANAIDRREAS